MFGGIDFGMEMVLDDIKELLEDVDTVRDVLPDDVPFVEEFIVLLLDLLILSENPLANQWSYSVYTHQTVGTMGTIVANELAS